MAKKKQLDLTPRYYVYYDKKSGKILSIGNEKDDSYEYGIESTWPEVENLVSGAWSFKDYLVAKAWSDALKGKAVSVPGWQYRLLTFVIGLAPRPMVRRVGMKVRVKQRR